MSPDKLVYMANQIGKFFAHETEDKAVADTADHLKKFWDPRMRKEILAYLAAGGAGLDPIALKAVTALRETAASHEEARPRTKASAATQDSAPATKTAG
jgi:formate dehydrogenase subunit delta